MEAIQVGVQVQVSAKEFLLSFLLRYSLEQIGLKMQITF